MKKLIYLIAVIVILGLIVPGCIPVVPSTEQSNTENLTKSDTWNVPGTYSTIQETIDVAAPGDTINVAAGIYIENLVIDKQLVLQGAGNTSTIIDASGGPPPGILLEAGGVSATQRMVIKDLQITKSTLDGIRAYKVGGFNLDYVTLENLLINLNAGKGVELHNGTNVYDLEIKNCEFINNGEQGLRASSATPVDGLTITNSHLDSNSYGGYLCGGVSNLTVSYTTMNDNSIRGWYCGEIGKITNIKFENCEANDNGLRGITVFTYNAEGIDGVEIRNTEIKNNLQRGLHIGASANGAETIPAPIKNVLVEDCDILHNGNGPQSDKAGFHLDIGELTNVVVRNCNIEGNNDFGVYNADTYSLGVVDATCNWWGDDSGPDGEGPGTGDAVSLNVLYNPWLTKDWALVYTAAPQPVTLVVLEATLSDSTTTGIAEAEVEFFVNDNSVGTAITLSNGVASLPIIPPYGVGIYEVYVSFCNLKSDTEYLAVYDPFAGFVTGGGWIYSPAGAYSPNQNAEGKASFGFVSKYKKGQSEPTGKTEFQFKAGDLNFHSESYDWLIIAGTRAKYKGTGTINGTGNYGFMLFAIDDEPDMFRIKIWDKDDGDEAVVYDNKIEDGEDDDYNTIELGGGQIVIHKGK